MAPPPAKRPRRSATTDADEDDADTIQRRASTGGKLLQNKNSSSTRSINATKLPLEAKGPNNGKNKRSISSYFDAAGPLSQRRHDAPKLSAPQDVQSINGTIKQEYQSIRRAEEDIVEDITDNEDSEGGSITQIYPLDRRKVVKGTPVFNDEEASESRVWPNNSQKFKFSADAVPHTKQDTRTSTSDLRPWADRFGPVNLDELAVHKKKISDVRQWLETVLSGRNRKRLLIVKGPAGTGKTATIKLLAQTMDLDISEWRNPVGTKYSSEGYTSMSTTFEDFLGRSSKFRRLDIEGQPDESASFLNGNGDSKQDLSRRKLVLVEEFPNAFLSTSPVLQSFRLTVLQYLTLSLPHSTVYPPPNEFPPADISPLIMIITETRPSSFTSSSESFTVHRLLGSEILHHPSVSQIEFNPVANTIMKRALNLVLQKEARQSGRQRFPAINMLNRLGEAGDIRSAIGSLEFLCMKTVDSEDWTGKGAVVAKTQAETPDEIRLQQDSTSAMSMGRESNVGLFHAIGKVVYNKRYADTDAKIVHPPEHLSEHARHLVPETSIDQLMNETGSDSETFIAALHENYAWSCEGNTMIENLEACLSVFSDGDLLLGSNHGFGRRGNSNPYGAASDSLKQDEIAFQSVVRGILFALPYPVNRSLNSKPLAGKRSVNQGTFKMLYPVSMRIQRHMEEVQGLIEQWHLRFNKAVDLGSKSTRHNRHHRKAQDIECSPADDHIKGPADEDENDEPLRQTLVSTISELILERLPYITKIQRQGKPSGQLAHLEMITQFGGIQPAVASTDIDDSSSDEDFAKGTATVSSDSNTLVSGHMLRIDLPDEGVEKLYLSDDDIEDD